MNGLPLASLRRGQRVRVRCEQGSAWLVEELHLALGAGSRLRGLLGRSGLSEGEGMLLRPCRGIHTLFMRFAIDVLFLDDQGRVVALREELVPWRLTPLVADAEAVLELPAGTAARAGVTLGTRLLFIPVPASESGVGSVV